MLPYIAYSRLDLLNLWMKYLGLPHTSSNFALSDFISSKRGPSHSALSLLDRLMVTIFTE
jgi:hypothetical protein